MLDAYVSGLRSRAELAQHFHICESSVKMRIRGLCQKLAIKHMSEVYRLLLVLGLTQAVLTNL